MNPYMKRFLVKAGVGAVIGVAFIIAAIFSGLFASAGLLGILIPIICLLYGVGWVFAYKKIIATLRKMLGVGVDVSIIAAIFGKGAIMGILILMLVFTVGMVAAVFIGVYLAIRDLLNALKGLPPVSDDYVPKNYDKPIFDPDRTIRSVAVAGVIDSVDKATRVSSTRPKRGQSGDAAADFATGFAMGAIYGGMEED